MIHNYLPFKCLVLAITASFCSLNAQVGVDFDGTDDKIDCGNNTSVQITGTAITLEAWIYPTQWNTNPYDGNVICKEDNTGNNGYMLRVGGSGRLNFALGDGTKTWSEITSGTILTLNQWQHIAGTYDGSMIRLYLDGVAVDSAKATISIGNASGVNLLLGAHSSYARYYKGILDEVRIWNICRSEAELLANLGDEFCSPEKGLKAYYKFNQGKPGQTNLSYKKTNDLSKNGNTGTLTNFNLKGNASNWVKGYSLNKGISYGGDTLARCDFYYSPSTKYKWTKTGVYKDTIFTAMECDSALTMDITIKTSSATAFKAHACVSYTSPSGLYTWTQGGIYKDYLRNSQGCDSVLTITLSVGGSRDTIYPAICNSYQSPSAKHVWTKSGAYADTLVNYRGCDSIIQVELQILEPTFSTVKANACKFYVGPGGKRVYTKDGIYKDTLVNQNGCDSFVTTQLNILESVGSISPVACKSYISPSKKRVWTQTGVYKDTVGNYAGCDSVVTVNLTINQPTTAQISTQSCGPYVAPSKKKIWSITGVYKDTIANSKGCDSLIQVNLTVTNINPAIMQNGNTLTAVQAGATYRWLNCKTGKSVIAGEVNKSFTPTVDGNYASEVTLNNCVDTTVCMTVSGVGIANLKSSKPFVIMPNPASAEFYLYLPEHRNNVKISIFDCMGRLISQHNFEELNFTKMLLNVPSGIYTVMVEATDYINKEKLLIIH